TAVPTFGDPGEVLAAGGVCLAGPEVPIDGSAKRLFEAIESDPGATLLQVGSSNEPAVESAGCTVDSYRHTAHPPIGAIDDLVDSLVPVHTVVCHGNRARFKGRYDGTFTWTDTTPADHTLYADGEWHEPPWIDDSVSDLIRESHNRKRGARIGDVLGEADLGLPELPAPGRGSPDLAAAGLDVEALAPPATAGAAASADRSRRAGESPASRAGPALDEPVPTEPTDPTADGPSEPAPETERGIEGERDAILARLDRIEGMLAERDRTLRVRAIDAGDGEVLFRALEDVAVEHGEELVIRLPT
ncbi:MAG: hypothetical protein QXG03_07585, partial [Halalkalicoccus sp.]